MVRALLSLLVMVALPCWAQQPSDPPEQTVPETTSTETSQDRLNQPIPEYTGRENDRPSMGTTGLLFRTLGSLLVVIGLAMLLGYLGKRLMPSRFGGGVSGDHLKIIQSLPLGPKRFVSLIEADGQRLLIGVTDHRIELIKSLDEGSFGEALAEVEEPKRVRELEGTL